MDEELDAPLLLWDKDCSDLIGVSAGDLQKKYKHNGSFPKELEALVGMVIVFKIVARKDNFSRRGNAFTVSGVIRDADIVQTHCAKLLQDGDAGLIKNLANDEEFKENQGEGSDSGGDKFESNTDVIYVDEHSPKRTEMRMADLDDQSSTIRLKKPKLEPNP